MHELDEPRFVGDRGAGERHDDPQPQTLLADGFDRGVEARRAHLAQRRGRRRVGHELRGLAARAGDDRAARGDDRRLVHAGLLAHPVERLRLRRRRKVRELERHHPRLAPQVAEHVVERAAAEREAALERGVDAHVEPRLDALGQELDRNGVHERPRHDREDGEQHQQPEREPRAEHAALQGAAQRHQLIADQAEQRRGDHRVEDQEQRIVAGEDRGVRARRGEQEEEDPPEGRAGDEEVGHFAASAGKAEPFTSQRFQGEASVHSRLASALTWNGFGSCAVSRRMRTYAW